MGRSATGAGRRRPQRRSQRRRFLIACEGDKEVEYFRRLSKRLGGAVVLRPVRHWPAPEHVLALAVRERDADRAAARESGDPADVYDGVWMVVDVDEHAHLVRALRDADRAGVSSAVSGPCFEVWLILHLDDRRAAFTTPKAVKDHWAKLSGPTRNLPQQFAQGDGHVADAIDRAAALLAAHDRERTPRHQRNPSTEVGLLLLAISEASGENVRDL